MRVNVKFEESGPTNIKLSESTQNFKTPVSEAVNITVNEAPSEMSHTELLDLDVPNQHSIPVIKGLQAELDSKLEHLNYATTADIDAMFKSSMKRRAKYNG